METAEMFTVGKRTFISFSFLLVLIIGFYICFKRGQLICAYVLLVVGTVEMIVDDDYFTPWYMWIKGFELALNKNTWIVLDTKGRNPC